MSLAKRVNVTYVALRAGWICRRRGDYLRRAYLMWWNIERALKVRKERQDNEVL